MLHTTLYTLHIKSYMLHVTDNTLHAAARPCDTDSQLKHGGCLLFEHMPIITN